MTKCLMCKKVLGGDVLIAWRGGLFCDKACTLTYSKINGIYDQVAEKTIEDEMEEVMGSDIGVGLPFVEYDKVKDLVESCNYVLVTEPKNGRIYQGEYIECTDNHNLKLLLGYDTLTVLLKNAGRK